MESNIEVPIMHDGKELHLRLDLGAMELFEETFGEPLSSVFKRFESMGLKGEFPIKETRQLLYTLLKHEN
ncbi:MAG: gene transfer agent family protein, partial [Aestuariibacter sp.]|nr:gene transfer agent family protein [Aestuariibacter sp.]